MMSQWRHLKFSGTHFGINGFEEVDTYTPVSNKGESGVPYRKSRETTPLRLENKDYIVTV